MNNYKSALLTGTAVMAISVFSMQSQAQAQAAVSAGASGVWSSDASQDDDGTLAEAAAGAALDITADAVDITVTNNGTANDGSANTNTFAIGAITDSSSAENGDLIITTGSANNLTVTIASGVLDGNVSLLNTAADGNITATITDSLTAGGTLVVNAAANATTADAIILNVGDALNVTGTTAITAGANAGGSATAAVDVNGDATFTGAVTVTGGGGNASNDSSLTLSGATNTFTGGLTLTDGASGQASLTLDGTSAQTVAGNIAGNGDITINNASGVTFSGTVASGTIAIEKSTGNSSATFQNAVTSAITLGGDGNSGDVNTLVLDGQTQGFTVTGAIAGTASETNNISVVGGNAIVQATASTSNLTALSITGSGTKLDSNAALTVTSTTIGSGATLDVGSGLATTNITSTGTVQLTGTGGVSGTINGAGTLDVDANATVTGNIGTTTALTAIDIAAGTTLTTTGDVIATTTTLSGAGTGTLAIAAGNNAITTNIVTATDTAGAITIANGAGTTTITGNIGTSSAGLATLAVAGGANQTVTTTGNLYIGAITLDDADSLQFIGEGTQVISGTINGVGAGDGGLVVGNGTTKTPVANFDGIIGATNAISTLTVNDNAKAVFNANATFNGALSADAATIEVADGSTLTAATQTDADVTQWNIQVSKVGGGSQTNGTVVFSGDAVNLAVDTVNFDVQSGSAPLTVGASVLNNVFQGNAAATITGATVTDNSYIYGFALVADTNNVDVTVTQENSIEDTVANSGYASTGNQLITTLSGSTDTQINLLQSTLGAASTQESANNVIEAASSDVSGGAVVAGISVASQTASVTNTRLAALRSGQATGMSAGNVYQGLSAWGEGFGKLANQDDRDGVSGYDSNTYGMAFGVDTDQLGDNLNVGLALSYANTDVDSDSISNSSTEVDSYQVSVYGNYDLDDRTYVSGQLGYIFANNDTKRNPGGISSLTASGNYDSNIITAGIEVGRSYSQEGGLTLTPHAIVNYVNYSSDKYTETGAGGANLTVDSDNLNLFEIGAGIDAAWEVKNYNGSSFKPQLTLGVRHDVIGDQFEATNTFAGGGSSFKVKGFDPAQTTINAGANVTYLSVDAWELSAQYNFEYKEDYTSNAGLLKAAYKF